MVPYFLDFHENIWFSKTLVGLTCNIRRIFMEHSRNIPKYKIPVTSLGCIPRNFINELLRLLTFWGGDFIILSTNRTIMKLNCNTTYQQTLQVYSTLKRRGNGRFHVVSAWNTRGVFVGLLVFAKYCRYVCFWKVLSLECSCSLLFFKVTFLRISLSLILLHYVLLKIF